MVNSATRLLFTIINVRIRPLFLESYYSKLLEQDSEPRQSISIGPERESAVVLLEHFADKDQADALSATFGGEEGAEQLGLRLLINAFASVSDFQADRSTGSADVNLAVVVNRFGGVLDDVDQHLLEEGIVQIDNRRNGVQLHHDPDIPVQANRFHKTLARKDDAV